MRPVRCRSGRISLLGKTTLPGWQVGEGVALLWMQQRVWLSRATKSSVRWPSADSAALAGVISAFGLIQPQMVECAQVRRLAIAVRAWKSSRWRRHKTWRSKRAFRQLHDA
jgi:hypothetical protein